jgi:hypothetical protein
MESGQTAQNFETLKRIDSEGNEFWFARALGKALGYRDFRNFTKVIEKAVVACESTGHKAFDHIVEVNEMIETEKKRFKNLRIKKMINCQQGLVLRSKSSDLEAQMAGYLEELGYGS